MARKKVKLAWIANDAVRHATFKKRCEGLLKKVSELGTLCGVTACAVIYGPDEAQPEVFPNEPEARRILQGFRALPEIEQSKKMMNQEKFLHQRMTKVNDQLARMQQSTREAELIVLMYECLLGHRGLDTIAPEDMAVISFFIDMRLKAIRRQIKTFHAKASSGSGPSTGLLGDGPHGSGEQQGMIRDLLGPGWARKE